MIRHSKPLVDQGDIDSVAEVLRSGNIAQGNKVKEFEGAVSKYLGARFGVAVSTGTAAIHLALASLGVGFGDEVIMPSYICTSPYLATLYLGAKPVVVDIDKVDFNISVASVKEHMSPKTKAIIAPHMFGMPCEVDSLLELGVPVVEDCAQAIGAAYKKRRVGGLSSLSICSFYATKMMTTGEGGMVLTSDEDVYERLKGMREYDGRSLDVLRFNYKLTDFQAALGLSQLEKLDDFISRRRSIAKIYDQAFQDMRIELPMRFDWKESVYYRYIVLLNEIEKVRDDLRSKDIFCERPVKELLPSDRGVACARFIHDRALSVPIYPNLSYDDVELVCKSFRRAVAGKA
jgi:perosamine synthetase